jgi:putative transposase
MTFYEPYFCAKFDVFRQVWRCFQNWRRYCLSDEEWEILKPLIPPAKSGGRPREVDMREVMNGIFYVLKSGCQWSMLPHEFPPKGTIYDYFNKWRKDGTWKRMNEELREQVREKMGRNAQPSAASIDSQSVKTTEKGG